jgi:hypothetical protein
MEKCLSQIISVAHDSLLVTLNRLSGCKVYIGTSGKSQGVIYQKLNIECQIANK